MHRRRQRVAHRVRVAPPERVDGGGGVDHGLEVGARAATHEQDGEEDTGGGGRENEKAK